MRQKSAQPVLDSLADLEPSANGVANGFANGVVNGIANGVVNGYHSPKPPLTRAKTDIGGWRRDDNDSKKDGAEGEWSLRHGFESQLVSEEYTSVLTSVGRRVAGAS